MHLKIKINYKSEVPRFALYDCFNCYNFKLFGPHLSRIHTISGLGSPSALHVKNADPPKETSTSCGSLISSGGSVKLRAEFYG